MKPPGVVEALGEAENLASRLVRRTRSGAGRASASLFVVAVLKRRLVAPSIPKPLISRPTRFRPTRSPSAPSAAWIRGRPYVAPPPVEIAPIRASSAASRRRTRRRTAAENGAMLATQSSTATPARYQRRSRGKRQAAGSASSAARMSAWPRASGKSSSARATMPVAFATAKLMPLRLRVGGTPGIGRG